MLDENSCKVFVPVKVVSGKKTFTYDYILFSILNSDNIDYYYYDRKNGTFTDFKTSVYDFMISNNITLLREIKNKKSKLSLITTIENLLKNKEKEQYNLYLKKIKGLNK